jgi:hypothetical protein
MKVRNLNHGEISSKLWAFSTVRWKQLPNGRKFAYCDICTQKLLLTPEFQHSRNSGLSLRHAPRGRAEFGALFEHLNDSSLVAVADGSVDGPDAVLVHGLDVRAVGEQDLNDPDVRADGRVVERRPGVDFVDPFRPKFADKINYGSTPTNSEFTPAL